MGREGCGDRRSSTSQDQPQYSRKYVPSEDIGDYEVLKKEKSSKKTSGPLYPLTEEGDYGAPPAPIPRQRVSQQYEKRERKLKVYASYAVDSDCCAHSKVLTRNESDRGRSPPKPIRRRNTTENRPPPQRLERKGSARLSQSSRRSSKAKSPSPAPSNDIQGERPGYWQNSLRSTSFKEPTSSQRKPTRRESKSPGGDKFEKSVSPAPAPVTAPRARSLSDGRKSQPRDYETDADMNYRSFSKFTEDRNQNSSSFSAVKSVQSVSKKSSSKAVEVINDCLPLGKGKVDESSVWDSMGVLGLSSKMFSASSSQERFSVSSSIIRKQSVTTHAM